IADVEEDDEHDSSLDQPMISDEDATRLQIKREKLMLIENIERQIRENLEQEESLKSTSLDEQAQAAEMQPIVSDTNLAAQFDDQHQQPNMKQSFEETHSM